MRLLLAGELHPVAIPSLEEEGLRDLVRAREDLRGELMSARQRVSKLLLRHDVRFDGPERNWTQSHLRWLSTVRFEQPGTQAAFDDYRGAAEALIVRRGQLERMIADQLPVSPFAHTAAGLMCLRGIDTLTAAGLCAEIGDFRRFAHPSQVMSYLGVVPSESSSGTKRRQGSITKSCSQHARRLLVEAAWHYRQPPHASLSRRAAAKQGRIRRSSPSRGRPSGGCITCGRGWSAAASAGRSSPSPPPASSPASAGRSPPPTDPANSTWSGRRRDVRAFAPEHP